MRGPRWGPAGGQALVLVVAGLVLFALAGLVALVGQRLTPDEAFRRDASPGERR